MKDGVPQILVYFHNKKNMHFCYISWTKDAMNFSGKLLIDK